MPAKYSLLAVTVGEHDQNHPSEVFPMVRESVWWFEMQKTQKNLFFFSSLPKIQCVLDRLSRSQNLAVPKNQKHFFLNV